MQNNVPSNGVLSGMIITATAAAVTISLVIFSDVAREIFNQPLGDDMLTGFSIGALVMIVHKLESLYSQEYERCPVYLTQSRAWGSNPARAIFLSFVSTFLGMLIIVALALMGPPWHFVIVTVWIAQGLHELHHIAKSFSRRTNYPGLFTSLLFVAVQSGLMFPLWNDAIIGERGVVFTAYYIALPIVALAYYIEDRRWTARAPRFVWDHRVAPDPNPLQLAADPRSVERKPSVHA